MSIQRAVLAATIAAMLPLASSALAQSRPDSRAMTCTQVQSLIQNAGAVVLTTGRHTFDRYVSHGAFCSMLYEPVQARIQTSDGMCTVYRCDRALFERNWPMSR